MLRELARGAMGELWVADEQGVREVAIKFLRADRVDADLLARFQQEINLVAGLKSPHVVHVYGWGSLDDGTPYMAMEYLQGQDLSAVIDQRAPLPISEAVDYVVEACAALHVAHNAGIVHRDIKPANLFVSRRSLRVLDFGVAKVVGDLGGTQSGTFLGTYFYAAPEQLTDARSAAPTSDIWALGVVLYELLTGRRPFEADEPMPLMVKIQHDEPAPVDSLRPGLPPALATCIARCLQKSPAERPQSAAALILELAQHGGHRSKTIAQDIVESLEAAHASPASAPPADQRLTGSEATDVALTAPTSGADAHRDRPSAPGAVPDEWFGTPTDLLSAMLAKGHAPGGDVRNVVFMLGSGFSLPSGGHAGVPSTVDIVELIKARLDDEGRSVLDVELQHSRNQYQTAFRRIYRTRGADAANRVVREAVLRARKRLSTLPNGARRQEEVCREYEKQVDDWDMPPGAAHLGAVIAGGLPSDDRFSQLHLTTNFDPLLAIAIRRRGGLTYDHAAARVLQVPAPRSGFCTIVHLHGRWDAGDTLHVDLDQARAQLEGSLRTLLSRNTLVVLGYGGWDDVFMASLKAAASGNEALDVIWGFYETDLGLIGERYGEAIALKRELGERLRFYRGVDTNMLFRDLRHALYPSSPLPPPTPGPSSLPPPRLPRHRWGRWAVALAGVALLVGAAAWSQARRVPFAVKLSLPHGCGELVRQLHVDASQQGRSVEVERRGCEVRGEASPSEPVEISVGGALSARAELDLAAERSRTIWLPWPPTVELNLCGGSPRAPPWPDRLKVGDTELEVERWCDGFRSEPEFAEVLPRAVSPIRLSVTSPFYRLVDRFVEVEDNVLAVGLEQTETFDVEVELSGDCDAVRSLSVNLPGGGRVRGEVGGCRAKLAVGTGRYQVLPEAGARLECEVESADPSNCQATLRWGSGAPARLVPWLEVSVHKQRSRCFAICQRCDHRCADIDNQGMRDRCFDRCQGSCSC